MSLSTTFGRERRSTVSSLQRNPTLRQNRVDFHVDADESSDEEIDMLEVLGTHSAAASSSADDNDDNGGGGDDEADVEADDLFDRPSRPSSSTSSTIGRRKQEGGGGGGWLAGHSRLRHRTSRSQRAPRPEATAIEGHSHRNEHSSGPNMSTNAASTASRPSDGATVGTSTRPKVNSRMSRRGVSKQRSRSSRKLHFARTERAVLQPDGSSLAFPSLPGSDDSSSEGEEPSNAVKRTAKVSRSRSHRNARKRNPGSRKSLANASSDQDTGSDGSATSGEESSSSGRVSAADESAEDDLPSKPGVNRFSRLSTHLRGNYCVAADEMSGLIVAGSKDCTASVWQTEPSIVLKFTLGGNALGHKRPITCICISGPWIVSEDATPSDFHPHTSTGETTPRAFMPGPPTNTRGSSRVTPAHVDSGFASRRHGSPDAQRNRQRMLTALRQETPHDSVHLRSILQFRRSPFQQLAHHHSSVADEGETKDAFPSCFGSAGHTIDSLPNFSPIPEMFCITGSQDKVVKMWDLHTGAWIADLARFSTGIYSLAIQNGNRVAVAGSYDAAIYVISIGYRCVMQKLANHHTGAIWSLAMLRSQDIDSERQMLVAGSGDSTLSAWTFNPRLGKYFFCRKLRGHRGAVLCVKATTQRRDNLVLSSSRCGVVKVWATGAMGAFDRPLTLFGHASTSPNGGHAVDLSRFLVFTCIHTIQCSLEPTWALAVTGDDCSFVTCSADCKLLVWDIESAALQNTIVDLATAAGGESAKAKARAQASLGLKWHSLKDIALLHHREKIVFVSDDDEDVDIVLWDTSHGSLRQELTAQTVGIVRCVSMQTCAMRVAPPLTTSTATASNGTHEKPSVRRNSSIGASSLDQVATAASSSQGLGTDPPLLLVTGGDDGIVRVWNRDDGSHLFRCRLHEQPIMGVDVTEPHPQIYSSALAKGHVLPLARVASVCRSVGFVWHIFCTANAPKLAAVGRNTKVPKAATAAFGVARRSSTVVSSDMSLHRKLSQLKERLSASENVDGDRAQDAGAAPTRSVRGDGADQKGRAGLVNTAEQLYVYAGSRQHSARLDHNAVVARTYHRGTTRSPQYAGPDSEQPICEISLMTVRLLSTGTSGRAVTAASDGTVIMWQLHTADPRTVYTDSSMAALDVDALEGFHIEAQVMRILVNPACCLHPEAHRVPSFRNLHMSLGQESEEDGCLSHIDSIESLDSKHDSPSALAENDKDHQNDGNARAKNAAESVLAEYAHPFAVLSIQEMWIPLPNAARVGLAILHAAKQVKEQLTRRKFSRGWGFTSEPSRPFKDRTTSGGRPVQNGNLECLKEEDEADGSALGSPTTSGPATLAGAAARIAESLERSAAEERFYVVSGCAGGMCILWSAQGRFVKDLSSQLTIHHRSGPDVKQRLGKALLDPFYSLDQLLDSIQLVSRGKSARGHDSSSDGIANPSAHDSAIETRQRTKRPAPRKQQSNAVLSGHERKIQERNITFILKKHLEHILALDGGLDIEAALGHTAHFGSSASGISESKMSLRGHNGGFRYDPLLYLQTRSLRQLRAMLIHIGVPSMGTVRLERALAMHKFAGDYFLPHAISALAVEASGCNLAIGSFDCAVSVLRLRHSLSRAHETGTGALQEDSKNVLQLSSGTTSVWGAMRARAAASDGASSAVPSTNIGRTVFKANQPEPKNITAKLLWRQVLGPTQREFRVQETLELDYDFRVSSIAFISTKVLLVGTYHGRVKILRNDGRDILRSDLVLQQDMPIESVATDGQSAIVACGNIVRLYDLSPRQPSVEVAAYMCEEGFAMDVIAAHPNVVNCRDSVQKQTLLHIFASTGNVVVLGLLLEANVRLAFLRDCDNHTALDVAMVHRHPACVQLLVQDIIRRQDELSVEDRECVACSLPQLAVLYPSTFRSLLQNLRLCHSILGNDIVRSGGLGPVDFGGFKVGRTSSLQPASQSSRRYPHTSNHQHHQNKGRNARSRNYEHHSHRHHRRGAHHGSTTSTQASAAARPIAQQVSRVTGGFFNWHSPQNLRRTQSQSRPTISTSKGQPSLNPDGSFFVPTSVDGGRNTLAKSQLAVVCLPLVRGSAMPCADPRMWLLSPEYEHARQTAFDNFQLDRCVPAPVVSPLPYLCHPLIFKSIQQDPKLQDCLHCESIVPVVQFKWNKYAAKLFRRELYNYLAFLGLTTFATIMLTQEVTPTIPLEHIADSWNTLFVAAAMMLVQILTVRTIMKQGQSVCTERSAFFKDIWNWLVMIQILLVEATVVLYILRHSSVRSTASILSVVTWSRLLFYMRAHKETGALVRMILEIAKDMKYFLLILVLMILGFANATFVLLHNSRDAEGRDITPISHSSMLRSIVQLYSGVMGASENEVYDASPDAWLLWFLYILFTLMVLIIMLNLLIALMADSHERVNNQRAQARQVELAGIVVNIETEMRIEPHDVFEYFPKWVHVLKRTGSSMASSTSSEWTSRTRMVTQAVANASAEVRQELTERLAEVAEEQSQHISRTNKQLMHMLRTLAGDESDSSAELSESEDEEYIGHTSNTPQLASNATP